MLAAAVSVQSTSYSDGTDGSTVSYSLAQPLVALIALVVLGLVIAALVAVRRGRGPAVPLLGAAAVLALFGIGWLGIGVAVLCLIAAAKVPRA